MVCDDVYKLSLSLLGEEVSAAYSADYTERAPYLIGIVCSEMADIDRVFRGECGRAEQGTFAGEKIELSADFPLCDEFSPAAGFYLASLLIMDGDARRSDMFFEKYDESVRRVMSSLTFSCGSTVNKYPE